MLGLILIYFIGKNFYELAAEFNKSKWGFAILGVVTYYLTTFIVGLTWVILYDLGMFSSDIEEMNELAVSLIALPFGLLGCFGLYKLLQHLWSRRAETSLSSEILDADF